MKLLISAALVLLCVSLISACTLENIDYFGNTPGATEQSGFVERVWQQEPVNPFGGDERISHERLAHEITQAMNVPENMDLIYSGLPSSLRSEVSLELFRRYVEALRPANGEKINGFEELSEEEVREFQTPIFSHRPDLTDEALSSRYFRLEFKPASTTRRRDREMKSIILAVQTGENGAYLSGKWLKAVVKLRDYAFLYFDALSQDVLENNNVSSIAWLLQEGEPPFLGEGREQYSYAKARIAGKYYQTTVTTEPRASACLYILPGTAAFEQEYRYGDDLSALRTVRFSEKNGVFSVAEPIPSEQPEEDREIRIFGNPLFPRRVLTGQSIYSANDIHPLAGPVLEINNLDEENIPPAIPGQKAKPRYYEVSYYGMKIVIYGNADIKTKSWQGKVESVTLESRIGSLGQTVRPGMKESAFHLYYPFHIENGGELQGGSEPIGKMTISYTGVDGEVVSITLKRAE